MTRVFSRSDIKNTIRSILIYQDDLDKRVAMLYEAVQMWNRWIKIAEGTHSCHSELCPCDKTVEYAREKGWTK